nr:RloB family protein [Micromonospora sp. DSM 115978]
MTRREGRGRRGPTRVPRRTILVYCGAARTEPDYFDGLRAAFRGTAVKVRREAVAPEQLVRAADGFRRRHPGVYDEVWCVVDADEFDIEAAARQARRLGVKLAVSNPCFEVWLLLHHAACRSHCPRCGDVTARLRRRLPAYDKTRLRFADHADGVAAAVKRARELDPSGTDHSRNPSTGVWRLVELIMEVT